jgi:glycosyltransferase involved in cell wall biosynthesis
MDKLPISAFIIAKNEAERIGATLASVKALASEMIVVDSGSTDGTQEIAQQYGAKVMYHDWAGYGPQKRFAEEQCAYDWVLNLDADEVLSEALVEQIRDVFNSQNGASAVEMGQVDGYELLIRDCVPNEALPRHFAHTTRAVRLYRKSKGRYPESTVHDRVHFTSPNAHIHTLRAPVYHYSVMSMEQAIMKLNRYSTMQAADMQARGKTPNFLLLRLYTEFFMAFFKSYILRMDIFRGHAGFVNSMTYAFSRFARIAKVWEMRNK